MKTIYLAALMLPGIVLACITLSSCNQSDIKNIKHVQQQPSYHRFKFKLGDTISFPLTEHAYNNIISSSFFLSNGIPYVGFYDKGSKSMLLYNFETKVPVSVTPLAKWIRSSKLDKANVMFTNFDTIFATTQHGIYLFDSSGKIIKEFDFFTEKDKQGTINNSIPPVISGKNLYIGVKPNINRNSLAAHRRWRSLYKINLETGHKEMTYPLSPLYHKNLYGYSFLEYNYCINDKGNFVFSFPADSNVYETNLDSFQISYNAQSRFHKGAIPFITRKEITDNASYIAYAIRDSYGPIIYDPNSKYYYRQAKQGVSRKEAQGNSFSKKRSVIILDRSLRIIGEEEYEVDFSFTSLFFTKDGKGYVRVNPKDEYALHFAQFTIELEQDNLSYSKYQPYENTIIDTLRCLSMQLQ